MLLEVRLMVSRGVGVPGRDTGGFWVLAELCFLIWVLATLECSIWEMSSQFFKGRDNSCSLFASPAPRTALGTLLVERIKKFACRFVFENCCLMLFNACVFQTASCDPFMG